MVNWILFLLGKGWAWGVEVPTISTAPATTIPDSIEVHTVQGSTAGVEFQSVEIVEGVGYLWVKNGGHRERHQIFQSLSGQRYIRITLRSNPELGEISVQIM